MRETEKNWNAGRRVNSTSLEVEYILHQCYISDEPYAKRVSLRGVVSIFLRGASCSRILFHAV